MKIAVTKEHVIDSDLFYLDLEYHLHVDYAMVLGEYMFKTDLPLKILTVYYYNPETKNIEKVEFQKDVRNYRMSELVLMMATYCSSRNLIFVCEQSIIRKFGGINPIVNFMTEQGLEVNNFQI